MSESSRQIVSAEFGHMPENWAWSAQGKLQENDWILLGFYSNEGVVRLSWLYVDRLELVPNSDPLYIPETPVEVIQVRPLIYYQPPPFSVPKALCDAFSHAFHKRLENEELSPFEPTVEELSEVYQHLM